MPISTETYGKNYELSLITEFSCAPQSPKQGFRKTKNQQYLPRSVAANTNFSQYLLQWLQNSID